MRTYSDVRRRALVGDDVRVPDQALWLLQATVVVATWPASTVTYKCPRGRSTLEMKDGSTLKLFLRGLGRRLSHNLYHRCLPVTFGMMDRLHLHLGGLRPVGDAAGQHEATS